jgi:hypothetical protein
VIESCSSDQNCGLHKFPSNVGQRSRYAEALKLEGETMDSLGCNFYFLQGPIPVLPLPSSSNKLIKVALMYYMYLEDQKQKSFIFKKVVKVIV